MRSVQQTSAWEPFLTRQGLDRVTGSSIPKGLCIKAQGCEERATLGKTCLDRANPERVVPLKTGTQTQAMTTHTRHDAPEAWGFRFPWSLSTLRGIPVRRLARIPTGFRNKAQGCEERATLGQRCSKIPNPNGVEAPSLRWILTSMGRNPFGVDKSSMLLPRVARSSQPWALLRNPFGIEFQVASLLGFISAPFLSKDEDQTGPADSRMLCSA